MYVLMYVVGADEAVIECVIDEVKTTKESTSNNANASSDRLRLSSHIRTAAMLFVVTLVFVLTFAPAFLMSLDLILYNRLVFYIYFFNNVANPVIYSFMNNYFRRELQAMFCQLTTSVTSL